MNYDEMSIDELIACEDVLTEWDMEDVLAERCAARDAILDMAEALDAEGLVVVPHSPTAAMVDSGTTICPIADEYEGSWDVAVEDTWNAMIEAAPLMGVE